MAASDEPSHARPEREDRSGASGEPAHAAVPPSSGQRSRTQASPTARREVPGQQQQTERSGWHYVARALKPRATRAQMLAAALCGVVGFALVVQLQQNQTDDLANLRQSDLLRVLDEVTQRQDSLRIEQQRLTAEIAELESGSQSVSQAREAATKAATTQGILAGRLPAQGPGLRLSVSSDGEDTLKAADVLNLIEELRNAGAEVIQVGQERVIISSAVGQAEGAVTINGNAVPLPFTVLAIGDPSTLQPALEIPGGAVSVLRNAGVDVTIAQLDTLHITAVLDLAAPEFATPTQ